MACSQVSLLKLHNFRKLLISLRISLSMLLLKSTQCLPTITTILKSFFFSFKGVLTRGGINWLYLSDQQQQKNLAPHKLDSQTCPMYLQTFKNRHFYLFWIPFLIVATFRKQHGRLDIPQCLHPGLHMVNEACHSRQNRWLWFSAACLSWSMDYCSGANYAVIYIDCLEQQWWILVTKLAILRFAPSRTVQTQNNSNTLWT